MSRGSNRRRNNGVRNTLNGYVTEDGVINDGCFKVKLVRPLKHVMLELTEALPLNKGQWRRIPAELNSNLQDESGEWEN